jgi:ArsR family metal-binding transcriptional regulator
VARFRLDNWNVMIYRNGHIDIRRVKDVDDAAKAIEMVGIMLKDGFTS